MGKGRGGGGRMVGGRERRGWKEGEVRLWEGGREEKQHSHIHTHTQAGTDRTGEVSGSYYIRYMNMSFDAALYLDNHVNTRDM